MAIAKHPKPDAINAFIAGTRGRRGKAAPEPEPEPVAPRALARTTVMIRVPTDILARVDAACRRLGLNRTAFFVSTAVAKVDKLDRTE